jgi:2-dehydro-3-deoxyphosphogluconate aldolase/(4S)-4-hydroxy-2-oxoglutarate aldolase
MILEHLNRSPILGILRGFDLYDLEWVLPLYRDAGFTVVEISMTSPDAENLISEAIRQFGEALVIGAGTIRGPEIMDKALKAGAKFIVTPSLDEEVITECVRRDIPIFPGALSPTEIEDAWDHGATAVKIFPASLGGPAYIRSLRGPMDDVRFVPTGGVNMEDIPAYLDAGAFALGMGSPLFPAPLIRSRNVAAFQKHLEVCRLAVSGGKNSV